MKCSICKEKIEENFFGKIIGTYVNKKPVCRNCQRKIKKDVKENKV